MAESLLVNDKSVIKYLLQKYEHPELILTNIEWNILKELVVFLKHFEVFLGISMQP